MKDAPHRPHRCAAAVVLVSAILTLAGGLVRAADDKPAPKSPTPAPSPAPETPKEPEKSAGTAVDAAKDYTQRMKSDQPGSAVRTYWDVDAMLSDIFGEHLRRHSDAEQAEMKRLLLDFVEGVYATPAIGAAMKAATFENFKEQVGPSAGTAVVAFNVRLQDRVIPNSLHMKQAEGKWKVFDAGAGGRMMVSAIRAQYEPQAQRVAPLDYVKAMVTTRPESKEKQGSPPAGTERKPRRP